MAAPITTIHPHPPSGGTILPVDILRTTQHYTQASRIQD